MERPQLSKADLGEAARQMICARLLLAGVKVFRPLTEDTPVDLLVLQGDHALKCQCKLIYPEGKSGTYCLSLCAVRKWGPGARAIKHRYTETEVDFFLGYCLENDSIYVVPFFDAAGRTRITIRLEMAAGRNQHQPLDMEKYRNNFSLLKKEG